MRTCNLCGATIKFRQFVNGKWRNFQRRKYCLECSPFGSGNTKKLEKTSITSKEENKRKKKKNKNCLVWQKKARKERKKKLVMAFGDKCQICKYDRCYKAFDFHHVDPAKKDTAISVFGMLTEWAKIIKEVKKCILVCSNCHREIHDDLVSQERIEKIYQRNLIDITNKLDAELIKTTKIKEIKNNFCIDCNTKIDIRGKRCASCYNLNRKTNHPSKEQLLKEIEETNYCAVGRKYDVSDNCIRKWIK